MTTKILLTTTTIADTTYRCGESYDSTADAGVISAVTTAGGTFADTTPALEAVVANVQKLRLRGAPTKALDRMLLAAAAG